MKSRRRAKPIPFISPDRYFSTARLGGPFTQGQVQ